MRRRQRFDLDDLRFDLIILFGDFCGKQTTAGARGAQILDVDLGMVHIRIEQPSQFHRQT